MTHPTADRPDVGREGASWGFQSWRSTAPPSALPGISPLRGEIGGSHVAAIPTVLAIGEDG